MIKLAPPELQTEVENLRQFSLDVYQAFEDQHTLVDALNAVSVLGKQQLYNSYHDAEGPVKSIRKKVADILIERTITFEELQTIVNTAQAEHPQSFNRMYRNWYNMLYMFLFQDQRQRVNKTVSDLKQYIFAEIGHEDQITSVKFDFSGERETGSIRCWIAFFNNTHPKQTTAKQLFLNFEKGEVIFSFYDRLKNIHYPKTVIPADKALDLTQVSALFQNHVQQILDDHFVDVKNDVLELKETESFFKVSMSGKDISEEAFNYFMSAQLVVVHKDTNPKGSSYESQGETFTQNMKIGDYFYICRGNNRLVLIGQVMSDAVPCDYDELGEEGWVQRSYTVVKEAVVNKNYQGQNKWWMPNNNSTCIPIKSSQYALGNKELFNPYFKVTVQKQKSLTLKTMPLNQILYGPPGTGKTYHTIDLAVNIITEKSADHTNNKATFDQLREAGQIEFVTFHQNYSYEDFMVGLRPDDESPILKFKPQKGIFYQIAQRARNNYWAAKEEKALSKDFDTVLMELFQPLEAGGEVEIKMVSGISYYVTDFNGNTIYFRKSNNSTSHTLSIETLREIVLGTRILNSGLVVYYNPLAKVIREMQQTPGSFKETLKKYVLIIDEINRANISRVFGELITLLEEDKRLGEENALTLTLPNGETNFGVPPNLYMVGTMNTADKSISLIDIALRRRFDFIGKYPDYEVLKDKGWNDRAELLALLNSAIYKKKHTADYLIGHAYFLSADTTENILLKKVLPLLSEYFSGKVADIKSVFEQTDWSPDYDEVTYAWKIAKV